jgi:K+-sensing histidine kinase KdpD
MQRAANAAGTEWGDLLSSVAEQLKVPLTVIARQAELSTLVGDATLLQPESVRVQADAALQLVDSYLLGLELLRGQTQLELEPVSVSSILVDTAHALTRFARQYGMDVEVEVAGRYEPVMAHARGLRAALLSLGYGMVESHAAQQNHPGHYARLMLATHRTPHGIIAGMYGTGDAVRTAQWRAALRLLRRAPQPVTGIVAGTGAGLFVADTIFRGMATHLRVGVWQRQRGLAATLQPSQQLQLV